MIDTACSNAFVCFDTKNPKWKDFAASRRLDKRRHFIIEVDKQLVMPLVESRSENINASRRPSIQTALKCLDYLPATSSNSESVCKQLGRCTYCPRNKDTRLKTIAQHVVHSFAKVMARKRLLTSVQSVQDCQLQMLTNYQIDISMPISVT